MRIANYFLCKLPRICVFFRPELSQIHSVLAQNEICILPSYETQHNIIHQMHIFEITEIRFVVFRVPSSQIPIFTEDIAEDIACLTRIIKPSRALTQITEPHRGLR